MTEPLGRVIPGQIMTQLESSAEDQATSFVKREPVVLSGLLAGPIAGVVTLFAPGDPSKPAEQITAAAVALVLVLQGFVVRRFVAPEWKRLTGRTLPDLDAFPDPASYSDAFDDGSGVPAPSRPPASTRRPDDPVDEQTGVMLPPDTTVESAPRHGAPDDADTSNAIASTPAPGQVSGPGIA